jgi:hypothetical protein
MLLKWVRCQVAPERRRPFSHAQAGWRRLAREPGLVGQTGGWDVTSNGTACVLALWRDRRAYADFMATRHDGLVAATGQAGTYAAIDAVAGDVMLAIDGSDGSGTIIRAADCGVRAGRVEHFLAVQEQVWIPGMQAAPGMLGGWVARLAPQRFLVATWWSDLPSHAAYVAERLPGLREQVDLPRDLARLDGHVIAVEPRWQVP